MAEFEAGFGMLTTMRFSGYSTRWAAGFLLLVLSAGARPLAAQMNPNAISASGSNNATGIASITLDEAIRRAENNEPAYRAAAGDARVASLDKSIARAALLPSVTGHTQAFYTQPNGSRNSAGQSGNQPSPKFIANNAIHEYATQALVNETIGFAQVADAKRASALAAQAAAQQEIARRGLVAAVVDLYFSASEAAHKLQLTQRAAGEAEDFHQLTGKLEAGREVAHADVIKAQLQSQQKQRDVEDAKLVEEKARLELAVLLFPDPLTPYTLADASAAPPAVPSMDVVEAAARHNNPDLAGALGAVHAANQEVSASRAGYLPDLAMNITYGIDAPEYALNGPSNVRNLGYAAFATIDLPVWDWLATHHRVQQSEIRRDNAELALSYAQKHLVTQLHENYNEAVTANAALASIQQSVADATESLRLTRLKYSAGEATVLEVLDAQNTKLLVETELSDGTMRYRVALANLQTLTGTL